MTSIWAGKIALIVVLLGVAPDPSEAVIPHRALWPDSINSAAEFDRASRAEILVFIRELAESDTLSETALKERLGVDAVDIASIERLRRKLWKLVAENYAIAVAGCVAHEGFCPLGR